MKIFKRVLIGCLGLIVLVVVGFAVTAGIMLALGPPDSQPGQSANLEEPLAGSRPAVLVDPAPGEVPLPQARARVEIDIEEGRFRIMPGQPGEGIRVEGNYDPGIYELKHETVGEGDNQTVRISLRSRYSILRRLLTLRELEDLENELTIFLPPDVALAIHCRISKGESRVDLTGLSVDDLDLDLSMGEHELRIDEPNPLSMEKLRVRVSMGEFEAKRLGNARFRNARIEGSMGEMRMDLTGHYIGDAEVVARFSMGEARLRVPTDIHSEVERHVMIGEASGGRRPDVEVPEDAPHLSVKSNMTMGELRIIWD